MSAFDDDFYVQRVFTLSKTSKLTEVIVQQLDHTLEFAAPEDYRNTLIEIYHMYLIHEHEMLPANFEEMANHLLFLLDFLKLASKEMNAVGERKSKE